MVNFEMGCAVKSGEVLEMSEVSPCDVGSLFQIALVTLCNRAEQICSQKKNRNNNFAERVLFALLVTRGKRCWWWFTFCKRRIAT